MIFSCPVSDCERSPGFSKIIGLLDMEHIASKDLHNFFSGNLFYLFFI